MLSVVARLGPIAAAVVLAAAGAALARPGKVVVVERRTPVSHRPIAICNAMLGGPEQLTCLTGDVGIAEPLHMISMTGSYARADITSRLTSPLDSCGIGNPFDVKIRGGGRRGARASDTFAIGGVDVSPGNTRLLAPDKITPPAPDVEVGIAIDLDGDGRAEIVATSRQCPETQRAERRLAGKTVHQSICVAVWQRPPRTSRWAKNSESVLHFCQ